MFISVVFIAIGVVCWPFFPSPILLGVGVGQIIICLFNKITQGW